MSSEGYLYMFYQEFLCITFRLSITTKQGKQTNKQKLEWNQENLSCDSVTVQTIYVHISKEENYLRAFLFPIASLLCPSQPTHFASNYSCLTAEMTSENSEDLPWGQEFYSL